MKIFFTRQSSIHLENIYQFYLLKNELAENDVIIVADIWDCRQDPAKYTEKFT